MKFKLLLMLLLSLRIFAQGNDKFTPTDFVNPFIGTIGGGNTFPGAVVPWGMVSLSPHNTYSNPAGYINGENYFYGFGHVHLSGVGCNELGSVILSVSKTDSVTLPEEYKTLYSNEIASPGYYSLKLDELSIKTEVAAAKRSGMTRFITTNGGKINILFDVGRSLSIIGGGQINVKTENVIEGYNISGGFCGENNREKIFFSTKISKPIQSSKIWVGQGFINDSQAEYADTSVGTILSLNVNSNDTIIVKVGISYVNIDNARANLEAEIPDWDFDKVRNAAMDEWNTALSRIKVEGGAKEDFIKFYTALYHMLIHPNIINDVNGEYPLMGRSGIGKYTDRDRYSFFSLWDTYRTLHPFLTLVYPEKQSEIIKTMIDMYNESGYLPKWELAGIETYMMVGDPAAPVIADSYIKGINDFDTVKAFEAVLKPVLLKDKQPAPPIRAGYHELLEYGYIPFEQDLTGDWWVWGPVSTSLEYNLSDWTISRIASKMGNKKIADELYTRSLKYKNLFDKNTLYMRPRLKSGSWLEPFDPLLTEGSGDWSGSGGPGYVEGNAWNYTWFVPHDIPGLIEIFGGEEKFSNKLLESFENKQFTITNEPDIAYPYLFNYVHGSEHKASELVQQIIKKDFSTGANGLPGNDDCGTISGWLVFSMLGFYPDCPASELYQLGIPSFNKVKILLTNPYYKGNYFTIERGHISNIQSPSGFHLNGTPLQKRQLNHNDIIKGGKLIFFIN